MEERRKNAIASELVRHMVDTQHVAGKGSFREGVRNPNMLGKPRVGGMHTQSRYKRKKEKLCFSD